MPLELCGKFRTCMHAHDYNAEECNASSQSTCMQLQVFPHAGRITQNEVSLQTSAFSSHPPTFTLAAGTIGGPPTTFYWSRNGARIINGSTFRYNIALNGTNNRFLAASAFVSYLTVTGRFPGIYEYSVTNRAMSGVPLQTTFTILGMG